MSNSIYQGAILGTLTDYFPGIVQKTTVVNIDILYDVLYDVFINFNPTCRGNMARYALNLPADLKREAEDLARSQGVSLNQFILWSVSEKVGALKHALDDSSFPGITYRRGASGIPTPVLRGTGIRVQAMVGAKYSWRMSAADIAEQYDLPETRVREALAFYEAHRSEIDSAIAAEAALEPDDVETSPASGC